MEEKRTCEGCINVLTKDPRDSTRSGRENSRSRNSAKKKIAQTLRDAMMVSKP